MENSYFIYYLIGINLITFVFFGIDKLKASQKQWRIPEKTLFSLAFIGGIIGALLGMKYFKHKTKKEEFKSVIVLIILVQLALLSFIGYQLI